MEYSDYTNYDESTTWTPAYYEKPKTVVSGEPNRLNGPSGGYDKSGVWIPPPTAGKETKEVQAELQARLQKLGLAKKAEPQTDATQKRKKDDLDFLLQERLKKTEAEVKAKQVKAQFLNSVKEVAPVPAPAETPNHDVDTLLWRPRADSSEEQTNLTKLPEDVCWDWFKTYSCSRGDTCPWRHGEESADQASQRQKMAVAVSTATAVFAGEKKSMPIERPPPKVCFSMRDTGTCNRIDCPYDHHPQRVQNAREKLKEEQSLIKEQHEFDASNSIGHDILGEVQTNADFNHTNQLKQALGMWHSTDESPAPPVASLLSPSVQTVPSHQQGRGPQTIPAKSPVQSLPASELFGAPILDPPPSRSNRTPLKAPNDNKSSTGPSAFERLRLGQSVMAPPGFTPVDSPMSNSNQREVQPLPAFRTPTRTPKVCLPPATPPHKIFDQVESDVATGVIETPQKNSADALKSVKEAMNLYGPEVAALVRESLKLEKKLRETEQLEKQSFAPGAKMDKYMNHLPDRMP